MHYSESWLREWVNPDLTLKEFSKLLTKIGLEVEGYENHILDIAIPPNRGDCLSMQGIAREIAAVLHIPLKKHIIPSHPAAIEDVLPIHVRSHKQAPCYIGRIIRNINRHAVTPAWLQERLEACGLNCIHPIVDIVNYVMLELGQPMHAFDLNSIHREIQVRLSKSGEVIILLDGSQKTLDNQTTVIADATKLLAIAGVMGGADSGVTSQTTDIVLESAYFPPADIARARQQYRLQSESATRFERGVDPTIQQVAIERVTTLIVEIAQGEPGPLINRTHKTAITRKKQVTLTQKHLEKVTGICFKNKDVDSIFKSLHFEYQSMRHGWRVTIPPYRFDLSLPEDLIEEIIRFYGLDQLPVQVLKGVLTVIPNTASIGTMSRATGDWHILRQLLSDQGYSEIISYSFVEKTLQLALNPNQTSFELSNPMTAEMSVMRTNLWPGLIQSLLYNLNRQQNHICLFEIGTVFFNEDRSSLAEHPRLAGLIAGSCFEEQWGLQTRDVDFYDIKGHVEALLRHYNVLDQCSFIAETHAALHPGQAAGIYYLNQLIGKVGALHPALLLDLKVTDPVFVFELDLKLLQAIPIKLSAISSFPTIRRDLAILIRETVPAKEIQDTIQLAAGDLLKSVFVFDVYQGTGVPVGQKSIAFALILQHGARTLVDAEVASTMERTVALLEKTFGATLRNG